VFQAFAFPITAKMTILPFMFSVMQIPPASRNRGAAKDKLGVHAEQNGYLQPKRTQTK
jgi:hypothetical protein